MLENIGRLLVEHCSPTLAGIKVANMFSVKKEHMEQAIKDLQMIERLLLDKGIRIEFFGLACSRFLVYVYREKELDKLLKRDDIQGFLSQYGYKSFEIGEVFSHFENRLQEKAFERACFPHEIGLLLGYPLCDVEGFIRHKGENPLCSGCWKAYGNKREAEESFIKIDECRCKYKRLYEEGASIYDLTAYAV